MLIYYVVDRPFRVVSTEVELVGVCYVHASTRARLIIASEVDTDGSGYFTTKQGAVTAFIESAKEYRSGLVQQMLDTAEGILLLDADIAAAKEFQPC